MADWLAFAGLGTLAAFLYVAVVLWSNVRTVHLLKKIEKNTRKIIVASKSTKQGDDVV